MSDPLERARSLLASATPRKVAPRGRDQEIALLDWGGDGPLALLHHANGFSKGTLGLLAERLRGEFHVIGMDARGHGDSPPATGADPYAWDEFALDLLGVAELLAEEQGGQVALGLGHSFGGTSMLGAASRHPGLFERLVLVDPVVPPRTEVATPERLAHVRDMVEGARRRPTRFGDREEARARWATRSLFAAWLPEALALYTLDGLRAHADGGVELKCHPEVEAAVFAQGGQLDVGAITAGLSTPTLWLWASRGDFPLEIYQTLAGDMVDGRVQTLAAGHLAPMEEPRLVADATLRFCAETD